MATLTKIPLSGSTDGNPITVGASSSPGTVMHTASGTANVVDTVYLYVWNISTADTLIIEWGGAGAAQFNITNSYPIAANGKPELIAPGFVTQNSKVIRAYSAAGGRLLISGWVVRYTP